MFEKCIETYREKKDTLKLVILAVCVLCAITAAVVLIANLVLRSKNRKPKIDVLDEHDLDGDGAIDAYLVDTTGDGEADTVYLDTDGNGAIDTIISDTDGDGEPDTVFEA